MKKLLHIGLIAFTFVFIGTVDAKKMVRKNAPSQTIPVTKNEKQMFVHAKALKNASSSQEKVDAVQKLASDIKSNPNARLVLEERVLLEEIKKLEHKIAQEESYISYFDAEDTTEDKELLNALYADLKEVQTTLNKAITTRPQAVSYLNYWSVRALIATVGIALADQLVTGGAGRTALISATQTAGNKVGSAASTAWSYVPSWRSTPSTETISSPTSTEIPTEATGGLVSNAKWLAGGAVGLATSMAIAEAKKYTLQKTMDTLMNYIFDAEENPETINPAELQKARSDLQELRKQNKELEKQISSMKMQQQSQQ